MDAGKVDEAEEILAAMFPSGDKAVEVVQPCKEALDSLAPAVAAHLRSARPGPCGAAPANTLVPFSTPDYPIAFHGLPA